MIQEPTSVVLVLQESLIGCRKANIGDNGIALEDHGQAICWGGKYWGCARTEPPQRKRFALWAIKDFNEVIWTAVEVFQSVKSWQSSDLATDFPLGGTAKIVLGGALEKLPETYISSNRM